MMTCDLDNHCWCAANRIIQPKEPSIELIRILSEGTYGSLRKH